MSIDPTLAELLASSARVEEQVAGTRRDVAELKTLHHERLNVHSKRLGSLERSRAKMIGGSKVLGVVGSVLAALIGWVSYD